MVARKGSKSAAVAVGRSDIARHPVAALQSFGVKGAVKVMGGASAVEVARAQAACRNPREGVMRLFEDFAGLELHAAKIYRKMADLRRDRPEAFQFLRALVNQERRHADVLTLAGIEAACGEVPEQVFQRAKERFETIRGAMADWEASIQPGIKDEEMVAMIMAIEASELDAIYEKLVGESGAAFPRALAHGIDAQWHHLHFIQTGIDCLRSAATDPAQTSG